MSRSFKKVPGYVDRNPFMKKYSNKLLRKASKDRLQMLSNPDEYDDKSSLFSYFKKSSVNPYDICDWRSLYFSNNHLIFMSSMNSTHAFGLSDTYHLTPLHPNNFLNVLWIKKP